jgi:pyrroline-5-carboxylate reductase
MKSVGKIGFIGGGNMAEAIIRGLLRGAFPAVGIVVSEPGTERRRLLQEQFGVTLAEDNLEVVRSCGLVVLAVKPQVAAEVLSGIGAAFAGDKLLVSILAGVATATIEDFFDGSPRVVRAMPNTPALVGAGATALCPGRFASVDDLLVARHLFEAVGSVQVVGEAQMDAVTGLSGSGPAYVFTIIRRWPTAACRRVAARCRPLWQCGRCWGAAGTGERRTPGGAARQVAPRGTTIAGLKPGERAARRPDGGGIKRREALAGAGGEEVNQSQSLWGVFQWPTIATRSNLPSASPCWWPVGFSSGGDTASPSLWPTSCLAPSPGRIRTG